MKSLSLGAVVLVLAAVPAAAESRFFLAAGAGYVRPDDAAYRTIYGGQAIAPELSAMVRIAGGLCLTAGGGWFKKSGVTPELGLSTRATQSFTSLGLAYLLRLSPMFCLEAGAGVAGLSFREEALGKWVRGRQPGFKAEAGLLLVPEGERVFVGLTAGYMSARVPAADLEPIGSQDVRLGGLKIAVSVGVQLFGND